MHPLRTRARRTLAGLAAVATVASTLILSSAIPARAETRPIRFPVAGGASWTDTFGAPRSGGRTHAGQDLFAPKMRRVVATTDATVVRMGRRATLSGNYVVLRDAEGWEYVYVHLNNDTPGTDDGADRELEAFYPGLRVGQRVWAGQELGYLGDSGNAETTPPHLHFEIRDPSGVSINPADSLRAASHQAIDPYFVAAHSPTGNVDGLSLAPGGGRLTGWAYDPDTTAPIDVAFYARKDHVGDLPADRWRPDLAGALGFYGGQHAYDGSVPLPLGRSDVCAFALNDDRGYATYLRCASIDVPAGPFGSVDAVERVAGGIRVSGWVIDADTAESTQVYVSDGRSAIYAPASEPRWDVWQAYPGFGAAHGFSTVLPVGPEPTYFCITAVNIGRGGSSHLRCAVA